MSAPQVEDTKAPQQVSADWAQLRIAVPVAWKRWLEEAASVRAMSVAALVRQLIRDFIIKRHQDEGQT